MTVCYTCDAPSTIFCPVCGRGACRNHIKNQVYGYSDHAKYLCLECADRIEETARNKTEEERRKREEQLRLEEMARQAREKAEAEKREEECKLNEAIEVQRRLHSDYVKREVAILAKKYFCETCNGNGWLKKGWFFIDFSRYHETREAEDYEPKRRSAYYDDWEKAYTKPCRECKSGFLPGIETAMESLLKNLLSKGIDRRIVYEVLDGSRRFGYKLSDPEIGDPTLLFKLREQLYRHRSVLRSKK